MKVLCVGYRKWALSIYEKLVVESKHSFMIYKLEKGILKTVTNYKPDLILFYGWSWIVEPELIKNFNCIMLHPSPLPKYRGGSPIQNQIIRGEKKSAVTLFLMDEGMDTGPILKQKSLSLAGNLKSILERIETIGFKLTMEILEEGLNPIEQDHKKASVFKRRKPSESEVTIEEIKTKSSNYLYNKIRMLQDPYPNAFIKTADGEKLFLTEAYIDSEDT